MVQGAKPVWLLIAVMAVAGQFALLATGLTVAWTSNLTLPALLCALFGLGQFFKYRQRDDLHAICDIALQIVLVLLLGVLLTYAATAANFPYRDAELHKLDQIMGLDRSAYLGVFSARPWLNDIVTVAYLSLLPQFAIIPIMLLASGKATHAHRLLFAIGIALLATSMIATFVPAVSAFYYLDMTPPAIVTLGVDFQTLLRTIEALRSDAMQTIRLDDLQGLITFPSFHTAGGLLLAWAAFAIPYVRWVGLALNAALIAATPVIGAHYFVDLMGGAAVATISIFAARKLYVPQVIRNTAPRNAATDEAMSSSPN